jgi:hypothetical protein
MRDPNATSGRFTTLPPPNFPFLNLNPSLIAIFKKFLQNVATKNIVHLYSTRTEMNRCLPYREGTATGVEARLSYGLLSN